MKDILKNHTKNLSLYIAIGFTLISGVERNLIAQAGITSVPFLQIEPDSRGAGMGNANVAIADNSSAIFWNPAGLAFQNGIQGSFTHTNWLPQFQSDLFYDYLVGKYYIEGIGTIGGHITYLNLGQQERRGENNEELGDFRSYEVAVGFSYGFYISENFALGTGIRYIYSSLVPKLSVSGQETRAGTSIGIDLSMLYRSNYFDLANRQSRYSFGTTLSNFGDGIQYTDEAQKDPLPTILRAGWAFEIELDESGYNTIRIANDFSKLMARKETFITAEGDTSSRMMNPFKALFNSWGSTKVERTIGEDLVTLTLAEQIMIGAGIEYWYDKRFSVRTGYFYEAPNNGAREFITFGAGIRYDIYGVDFSYISTIQEDHPLANTIRFTLLINFD